MANLEGKQFVVTGGAGFIGSHVVDRLASLGAHVIVFDDLSAGSIEKVRGPISEGKARLIEGDVRDFEALRSALRDADGVFHMAVQCLRKSFKDPCLVHEVNTTGTLHALRAALEMKVPRFVYVSSSEAYGSAADHVDPIDEMHPLLPTTSYGASKAAGELYTSAFFRSYGMKTTIVRPFNAYGPRAHAQGSYGEVIPRFAARLMNGERPVIFGDGKQTRDFTYVEDLARGIVACLSETVVGEAVNISRGHEVSITDIALMMANLLKRPDLVPIFEGERPADVRRHLAKVDKAERLLGFRASVGIEEGLRRYISWVREAGIQASAREAGARNW